MMTTENKCLTREMEQLKYLKNGNTKEKTKEEPEE